MLTVAHQLQTTGKARFDFGTFSLIKRKPQPIKLINGDVGSIKHTKPFAFVSFKASQSLRDLLNSL